MNNKQALKSRKSSTSDRDSRIQSVLRGSLNGDEALLKYCCHFNFDSATSSALQTIDELILHRESQKSEVEDQILGAVAAAYRQRSRILRFQPDWTSTARTEKREVADALAPYLSSVETGESVTHGADGEIHSTLKNLIAKAEADFKKHKKKPDAYFEDPSASTDSDDATHCRSSKSKKQKVSAAKAQPTDFDAYTMKSALRQHMHKVRELGKELCGRVRSLRYIKCIKNLQTDDTQEFRCLSCERQDVSVVETGVLSVCGHLGCLDCLKTAAGTSKCVDPDCSAQVSFHHIVSAATLGLDREDRKKGGKYGHKLTTIVQKVRDIVKEDRVLVFCQFDDLKEKVLEALNDAGLHTVSLSGSVTKQIETVNIFQKDDPDPKDPRVLLLKMDDEQSAGLNLTNLNHAVFVHPLLAYSQPEYDAYETQAIGRIRRYGQQKTVFVHRYYATQTIDTEVKEKFRRDGSTHLAGTQ